MTDDPRELVESVLTDRVSQIGVRLKARKNVAFSRTRRALEFISTAGGSVVQRKESSPTPDEDIADLLATVRELRAALGAFVSPYLCRSTLSGTVCATHGLSLIDSECPVARARRLVNE